MSHKLAELFSYSVGIGAIIGLIRIQTIDRAYIPFVLLLWLGFLNEILTTIEINQGFSNATNNNIYDLGESILILWFYRNLGLFAEKKSWFWTLMLLFGAVWLADNFYFSTIKVFNSYFIIFYCFVVVLMSIQLVNKILFKTGRIFRNAQFIILVGIIILLTYKLLVEIFWVYGLNASRNFRLNVYVIMTYINLIANLIFALATLWIPRKREYTLL